MRIASSFLTVAVLTSLPCFGAPQLSVPNAHKETVYDVVVVGGTPAGIAAAIAASRMGKTVIIIEQSPVLGGMLASGVLRLDDHMRQANSGVMEEFRQEDLRDIHDR